MSNYFSFKNLSVIALIIIVLSIALGASAYFDKQHPDSQIFPKYRDLYVDNVVIDKQEISQGQNVSVSITVYNNSDKEKEPAAGVFFIGEDKTYDGSNVDYASQRIQNKLPAKTKKQLEWQIPISMPIGDYKTLIWLHELNDGAEFFVQDSWYSKTMSVTSGKSVNFIKGENTNASDGLVLKDLMITPRLISNSEKITVRYNLNNYSSNQANLVTGVFIVEKSKKYTGEDIDQVLPKQQLQLSAGQSQPIGFSEDIKLPAGEYKVLIWLHEIKPEGEQVIFDSWAPGNIVVGQ